MNKLSRLNRIDFVVCYSLLVKFVMFQISKILSFLYVFGNTGLDHVIISEVQCDNHEDRQ